MLVSYIVRGIQVCITAVAAFTAKEKRLRTAIVSRLVPTFGACLTGVSWVNLDNKHTSLSSFIREKAVELVKAPCMQTALGRNILVCLATSDLGCLSNISQILNHDSAARGCILNNAF